MMPEKFNNKTNGITQRRFLLHGNPLLADWVTDKIGDEWITNLPHIKELAAFVDDKECQKEFLDIKYKNKYVWLSTLRSTTALTLIQTLFLMYRLRDFMSISVS